jgi:hypothetical protein
MIASSNCSEFKPFRADFGFQIGHVKDRHAMATANQFATDCAERIDMPGYRWGEYAEVPHEQ